MAEVKKCAHEMCNCVVSEKEKYCSTFCEDAKGTQTLTCDCGHAACQVDKL
jgi:hypothetical protein